MLHETGTIKNLLAGLALLLCAAAAWSAEDEAVDALPPPPQLRSGEALEPEVTIRRTSRETVYEYRRNGVLFLVRVLPMFGPSYHFVDVNGDGALDYRPGEPLRDNVNQWILWRW